MTRKSLTIKLFPRPFPRFLLVASITGATVFVIAAFLPPAIALTIMATLIVSGALYVYVADHHL